MSNGTIQVDSLNSLFLSNKIEDIKVFYDHFSNREELIHWMRDRPKTSPKIFEVEGDTSIVLVIPTADFLSDRITTCKEKLFNGIQQVYVESHKPKDAYFNYSHNVNIGVSEARKFKPDWIIISNDDMFPVEPSSKLIEQTIMHDPLTTDVLFTKPSGRYHSFRRFVGNPTHIYRFLASAHPNRNRKQRLKLWDKFNVRYIDALYENGSGFMSRLSYRNLKTHLLTGSFTILSRRFVDEQKTLFDETFINGGEDTDLSLRLYEDESRIDFINYEVGDVIGASLGTGWPRILRNVVNETYLSMKIETGKLKL